MDPDNKKDDGAVVETLEEPTLENSSSSINPGNVVGGPAVSNTPPKRRWRDVSSLYLIIFLVLAVSAIAAGIVALAHNRGSSSKNSKGSSLTSDQLAQLSGNTTVVGDAKQTLDIQSNTVLEGQLLVRKDLNVAGSINVGGGLSLSSVTVGGQGNFGQLQINGTLSVSGNTTFNGSMSVQKNLSVAGSANFGGTLSAAQLSISNLQLTGDLQINRHITLSGGTPSRSSGTGLGSGGTTSINGSDTAGTVTINTGPSPAAGSLITVNFASKFNSTPHVVVTPVGSAAAGLQYYISRTTTSFTLFSANAPPGGSSFSFDYVVID